MSAELPMYMHELDGYEIEYSSNEFKHIRSKDSLEFELASKSYIYRCDHDRAFIGWSFTPAFRREIFELRFDVSVKATGLYQLPYLTHPAS
jgi:hypothetical protein